MRATREARPSPHRASRPEVAASRFDARPVSMYVVSNEADFTAGNIEPLGMTERISNVFQSTRPMLLHCVLAELVVLIVPFERLVFVDQVHDIHRTAVGCFLRFLNERMIAAHGLWDMFEQCFYQLSVLLILRHEGGYGPGTA